MKKICAALALLSIIGSDAYAEQSVAPDVRTMVKVSNHDVNRFVCPGAMQDMIYSKEKDITGHFSKNDAFIKFKIKKIGSRTEYATVDNELFLVCGGHVYNIIAQPGNMPSVTVRLTPPAGDSFKQNVELFKNMPLEKQALQIIREAYSNTYPSSYKVTSPVEAQRKVAIWPGIIEANLTQYVDVEGIGLRLKSYEVKSLAPNTVEISEKEFLRSAISDAILAVAVENHLLRPQMTTRLFVVEHRGEANDAF